MVSSSSAIALESLEKMEKLIMAIHKKAHFVVTRPARSAAEQPLPKAEGQFGYDASRIERPAGAAQGILGVGDARRGRRRQRHLRIIIPGNAIDSRQLAMKGVADQNFECLQRPVQRRA